MVSTCSDSTYSEGRGFTELAGMKGFDDCMEQSELYFIIDQYKL